MSRTDSTLVLNTGRINQPGTACVRVCRTTGPRRYRRFRKSVGLAAISRENWARRRITHLTQDPGGSMIYRQSVSRNVADREGATPPPGYSVNGRGSSMARVWITYSSGKENSTWYSGVHFLSVKPMRYNFTCCCIARCRGASPARRRGPKGPWGPLLSFALSRYLCPSAIAKEETASGFCSGFATLWDDAGHAIHAPDLIIKRKRNERIIDVVQPGGKETFRDRSSPNYSFAILY